MGIQLPRKKRKVLLLSIIYRLAVMFPLTKRIKMKLFLNLEWIFERLSHEYSFKNYFGELHPIRIETVSFLAKIIKHEYRLLDLGCHCGELTYLLSKICKEITGVDYNDNWISIAKRNFVADNIFFFNGEASYYLNLNEKKYDVLILSHILEHLDNAEEFLLKFKKHFKYIYIEVPDFEKTYLNLYRKDFNMTLIYMDEDHISEFDRDDLTSLLNKCNIKILEFEYRHGVQRLFCEV